MARSHERALYSQLQTSRFAFLPRGELHVHAIYAAVKSRFPAQCDDSYFCAENCSSGHHQPEWQHVVRKSLQAQKAAAGPVSRGSRRGYWRFS